MLMDPLHRLAGITSCSHHPVWSHAGRGTAAANEAARFGNEDIDRFSYAPLRFSPKHTHILGRARAVS
jgi:hypothetical protein